MKKKHVAIKIILLVLIVLTFIYRNFFIYTYKYFTYEPRMIDGKLEPPYPSYFEAFGSIQGKDSNNNSLRDDIEILANRLLSEQPYELREAIKLKAKNWYLFTIQGMGSIDRQKWWYDYWRTSSCFMNLHGSFKSPMKLKYFHKIEERLNKKLINTRERERAVSTNWQQMPRTNNNKINESMYNLEELCKGMRVDLCKIVDSRFKLSNKDSSKWRARSHRLQPKLYEDYHEKCHKK